MHLRQLNHALLTLTLACGFTLGLSACQSLAPTTRHHQAQPNSEISRLQTMVDSGVIRVGITADQAPLNMRNAEGELMGLDVDIIEALADAMGLKIEYKIMPFIELLPSVENGDVDMAASSITITAERNARVAFAGPYFVTGKVALSKSRDISNARSVSDLNKEGLTFSAVKGTTSVGFAQRSLPNATLVSTEDYDEAINLLLNDKVDAFLADDPVCMLAMWRHPDAGLRLQHTPLTVEPLGIALPANAPLLVNLVENYLEMLEYTGLLGQYKAKWLTDGPWVSEIR